MKAGLIGLGAIGAMHFKNISEGKIDGLELAGVFDERPPAPEKFPDAKIYKSLCEMFSDPDVDAVIIATPSFSHFELAKAALEAGKHALVEKPIALASADARELVKIAKDCGKICAVMLNQRTTPIYARIRELVASGELGRVNRASWFMTNWYRPQIYFSSSPWRGTWKGEAGGALINQSIHNIDIFTWIFGLPDTLRAWCKFGKYHDIEVEDEATACMEYAGGMTATFATCTGEFPGSNRFEIACDKGFLRAENGELFISRFESVADYTMNTKYMFGTPECVEITEKFDGNGEQHVGVLKNFVAAADCDGRLDFSAEEGYNSVCLANAMLLSAWTKSDVSFPFDDEKYARILSEKMRASKLRENPDTDFILDFQKSFR